ncbi:leucine-rich repeat-containing protein 3-like isoform X2 [Entelurus aequoreus]|uniref:leucine-rich repeat-containing protein 3-like isoform X2 n=1 Tax=Entelurus aequoreus TaxID=161455 RepID=UPI002B1CE4F5|nr:leucine-rich repeat-containing protein 3-like isoform X2 [Entelurus aequoreus]
MKVENGPKDKSSGLMGAPPRSFSRPPTSISTFFLGALWLLSTMVTIAQACPKSCHCADRNGAVVQCTSRNLENIPSNLPQNTVVLLLSSNRIRHVPKEAFMDLHRLRELDLSHNLIESLEVGAFQGNSEGLRTLDLSNNHLSSLPKETFSKLHARVRLSNNPWHCECSLQEILRELRLDPETVNETTDVAMFVAMFCWFSMVTAYIIYYIRHNQEDAKRHLEYLKSLPSSSHISKDFDTASSVF